MIEEATCVSRKALLTGLEDDHTDLAFSCQLLRDCVVKDALGCVEDERLDLPFFGLILSADLA